MNRLRPVGQLAALAIFVSMFSLALVQACKQSTPEQPKVATPKASTKASTKTKEAPKETNTTPKTQPKSTTKPKTKIKEPPKFFPATKSGPPPVMPATKSGMFLPKPTIKKNTEDKQKTPKPAQQQLNAPPTLNKK